MDGGRRSSLRIGKLAAGKSGTENTARRDGRHHRHGRGRSDACLRLLQAVTAGPIHFASRVIRSAPVGDNILSNAAMAEKLSSQSALNDTVPQRVLP